MYSKDESLKLPEGYNSIDDLERDLMVLYSFGGGYTGGRVMAINQMSDSPWTHAYSIEELGQFNKARIEFVEQKYEEIKRAREAEGDDYSGAGEGSAIWKNIGQISGIICAPDSRIPRTWKMKIENKYPERVTFDKDIEVIYRAELAAYDQKKADQQKKQPANAEAKEYNAAYDAIYHKNDEMLQNLKAPEGGVLNTAISRWTYAIANCMDYLSNKDGEQENLNVEEFGSYLKLDIAGITPELAKCKASAIEKVIRVFMDFDMKRFEFKDIYDLVSKDNMELRVITSMAFESDKALNEYKIMMKDPALAGKDIFAFNEEQISKFEKKFNVIMEMQGWFARIPEILGDDRMLDEDNDIRELLSWPMEELEYYMSPKMIERNGNDWVELITAIMTVKQMLGENPGDPSFGPGVKIEKYLESKGI